MDVIVKLSADDLTAAVKNWVKLQGMQLEPGTVTWDREPMGNLSAEVSCTKTKPIPIGDYRDR